MEDVINAIENDNEEFFLCNDDVTQKFNQYFQNKFFEDYIRNLSTKKTRTLLIFRAFFIINLHKQEDPDPDIAIFLLVKYARSGSKLAEKLLEEDKYALNPVNYHDIVHDKINNLFESKILKNDRRILLFKFNKLKQKYKRLKKKLNKLNSRFPPKKKII